MIGGINIANGLELHEFEVQVKFMQARASFEVASRRVEQEREGER